MVGVLLRREPLVIVRRRGILLFRQELVEFLLLRVREPEHDGDVMHCHAFGDRAAIKLHPCQRMNAAQNQFHLVRSRPSAQFDRDWQFARPPEPRPKA